MTSDRNGEHHTKLTVPSLPESVETVEQLVEEHIRSLNFSDEECDSIAIAVTEAVNNAIYHGNKQDPDKMVEFEMFSYKDEVRFIIRDQGTGFDPKGLPDPLLPENLLKESGRGIFIVKSLMDKVEFDFTPTGTTITLQKRRGAPA